MDSYQNMHLRKPFLRLIQIGLGMFWVASASEKLLDIQSFAESFAAYTFVSESLAQYLVVTVSCCELIIGVAILVLGKHSSTPYALMIVLLMIFSITGSYEYLIGAVHECGCGWLALGEIRVGPALVAKNLLLTIIASIGIRYSLSA